MYLEIHAHTIRVNGFKAYMVGIGEISFDVYKHFFFNIRGNLYAGRLFHAQKAIPHPPDIVACPMKLKPGRIVLFNRKAKVRKAIVVRVQRHQNIVRGQLHALQNVHLSPLLSLIICQMRRALLLRSL